MKISEKLDLLPPKIDDSDLDGNYSCTVNLKSVDPLELSRNRVEGERLYMNGMIDYEEFAVKYLGKTQEESQKMKAKIWIENAMKTNPVFQKLIIQTAAAEMGKEEELAMLEEQLKGGASGLNPLPQTGSKGGEPRVGNIKTETGMEQSDIAMRHEPRMSPMMR